MKALSAQDVQILKREVFNAINTPLTHNQPLSVDYQQYKGWLNKVNSCFVTLIKDDELRSCMGSLSTHNPLIVNLHQNAYSAAFEDPRFPALTLDEWPHIYLEISILSDLKPFNVNSENELIHGLKQGIHGLVLKDEQLHATFLPSVWKNISEPEKFIKTLKLKAGLPMNYWSNDIKWYVYETEIISFYSQGLLKKLENCF